jgi:putative nucleotidyltransferase with HDIG domain
VAAPALPDLEAAIRALIDRDAVTIPPYPGVAMRLQQLVASTNYGMNDLAKVAMTDPVVTGFLLRSANSAAYRGASQITSVADAVTRIGGADVVRIAIAASLGAQAGRKGALAALRRRIWQEALTSAVVCFQLANARRMNGQEAFVCGLLHDIGKVVATSAIEGVLAQNKDERTLNENEWMAFIDGFHVDLGKVTARKWSLAEVIQAVIADHHNPAVTSPWKPMLEVVRIADAVVAVMMTDAVVALDRLEVIPGLARNEAQVLLNAIPAIGPFVASMDEAAPVTAGPAPTSQVAAPPPRPSEPSGQTNFPATILRANGQSDVQCYRVSPNGLTFVSKERQHQKYLMKLQLRPENIAPFEVHASVESCRTDPEGFSIDGRLFALAGNAKDRWAALLAASGLADAAPAAAAGGAPAAGKRGAVG